MGKWECLQLSHKYHWSVLVVSEGWHDLRVNSHTEVGIGGHCAEWRCSKIVLKIFLKLLSALLIYTAAIALLWFSLLSSIMLKYVNTSRNSTFSTLKALPAGNLQLFVSPSCLDRCLDNFIIILRVTWLSDETSSTMQWHQDSNSNSLFPKVYSKLNQPLVG